MHKPYSRYRRAFVSSLRSFIVSLAVTAVVVVPIAIAAHYRLKSLGM